MNGTEFVAIANAAPNSLIEPSLTKHSNVFLNRVW